MYYECLVEIVSEKVLATEAERASVYQPMGWNDLGHVT